MDMSNTFSQHKGFAVRKIKKKIHRISDKSLVVIDEDLVKQLLIDEYSWCEQEFVSDGILLKIYRSVQGEQLSTSSLSGGRED
jgi:hypothetical protein